MVVVVVHECDDLAVGCGDGRWVCVCLYVCVCVCLFGAWKLYDAQTGVSVLTTDEHTVTDRKYLCRGMLTGCLCEATNNIITLLAADQR